MLESMFFWEKIKNEEPFSIKKNSGFVFLQFLVRYFLKNF